MTWTQKAPSTVESSIEDLYFRIGLMSQARASQCAKGDDLHTVTYMEEFVNHVGRKRRFDLDKRSHQKRQQQPIPGQNIQQSADIIPSY